MPCAWCWSIAGSFRRSGGHRIHRRQDRLRAADAAHLGGATPRCTVERLMRPSGLQGLCRGKAIRTTFPDPTVPCPPDRRPGKDDGLIHHSDGGSHDLSIRFSEGLAEAGIEPSAGAKGDSHDNALAETVNGLHKIKVIHRCGPWKTKQAEELAALERVAWFNHHRLMGR